MRPTVSPSRRGSGTGRLASTDQSSATSATDRPIGPTVSSSGTSGKTPSIGMTPQRDFSPTVSQAADGSRIEQPVSEPMPKIAQARSKRRRVPGTRAACGLSRMSGIVHGPVPRVLTEDAPCELGQVGLADDDAAGIEDLLHDGRVALRNVVAVDLRAVRRADPGRIDQILDESGAAGERADGGTAQGLVEPGDPRVAGRRSRQHRHAVDLDPRPCDGKSRDLHESRRGAGVTEHPLPASG